jgi:hypothetical protein
MALIGSQELLLIMLVFVLALFLIAFVLTLLYGLWNRRRDDRLRDIDERLKSIEERLK